MLIRKATVADIPAILKLIRELAEFEKEPNAVQISEEDLLKDGFGSHPLFHTFVAETQGEVIGMALYYYRYSTWKGKTIHLEDLIVTQHARGTGAGTALYKAVLDQAKKLNLRRVEWAVLDWNLPAIEFYKKSGAQVLDDWRVCQMDNQAVTSYLTKKEPN